MKTSNLAYRIPLLAASVLLLGGCYTMLRHPQADVTASDGHETAALGTDCGSCHAAGFEQTLVPAPYPYLATPFADFYDPPWSGSRAGWRGSGTGSGGQTVTPPEEDVRIIGSRGPATLPSLHGTSPAASAPAAGVSTSSSSPQETAKPSTPATGQQPGRRMKDSLDSKEPAGSKKKTDNPKDSGG